MNLTETDGTFHSTAVKYTFSSITHGTFSRKKHMLRHKTSLNFNGKNIEIIPVSISKAKWNETRNQIREGKLENPQICGS